MQQEARWISFEEGAGGGVARSHGMDKTRVGLSATYLNRARSTQLQYDMPLLYCVYRNHGASIFALAFFFLCFFRSQTVIDLNTLQPKQLVDISWAFNPAGRTQCTF